MFLKTIGAASGNVTCTTSVIEHMAGEGISSTLVVVRLKSHTACLMLWCDDACNRLQILQRCTELRVMMCRLHVWMAIKIRGYNIQQLSAATLPYNGLLTRLLRRRLANASAETAYRGRSTYARLHKPSICKHRLPAYRPEQSIDRHSACTCMDGACVDCCSACTRIYG